MLDRLMRRAPLPADTVLIPPLRIITRQSTDTLAIADRAWSPRWPSSARTRRGPSACATSRRTRASRAACWNDASSRPWAAAPAAHLARARLDHVKALLVETDLPIGDVAERGGFCSPEYMTAVFRKAWQTTPLRYRRTVRGR